MVLYCSAFGCKESFVKGGRITFHGFPKDEQRRKQWEIQLRRENFKSTKCTKICSKHFKEECFEKEKFGGTWLKPDALPTIFNFPEHIQSRSAEGKYSKVRVEDELDHSAKEQQDVEKKSVSSNNTPITKEEETVEQLQNMNTSIDNSYCCVPFCKSIGNDISRPSFHRFPFARLSQNEVEKKYVLHLQNEWVRALRIDKKVSHHMVVCGKHFKPSDFITRGNHIVKARLKKNAVPSLNLPQVPSDANTENFLKIDNAALKITVDKQEKRDAGKKQSPLKTSGTSVLPSSKEHIYGYSCLNQNQVLECLKIAASAANQCMNSKVQAKLLLEILSHCIYFHEKNNKQVKDLIEQLLSEIENLLQNIEPSAETERIHKLLRYTLQPIQEDIISIERLKTRLRLKM